MAAGRAGSDAWRSERRGRGLDIGRPPDHDLRSLLDAVLYVNRTGIPWRYLPHDYPHWNTVYAYFARWQEEGVFDHLNTLLRRQVRRQEGREDEPTACVIDSQSIKTSTNVPASEQGIDAGKKIVGRKRSIVIDTVGLLLAVMVTAASVQDSIAGQALIEKVAADHPTVRKTWVDGGYRQHLVEHAATLGIDMHIVRRDPAARGFAVLPRRWTVERTLGWLMNHRRLARDYEAHPPLRSHDPPRDDQPHDPPSHRRVHPELARHMNRTQPCNPGRNNGMKRPLKERFIPTGVLHCSSGSGQLGSG